MSVEPLSKSYVLKKDFKYRHQNPYHHKLGNYGQFVFRDKEAETLRGSWRENAFRNSNPLVVEIGPGFGYFMVNYCQNYPLTNFVGIDYRFKRSFNLVKKIARYQLKNIRYLRAKAERLGFLFGSEEVDEIFLFFPDPWPKKRHHKKRLLQPTFLDHAHLVLKPQGKLSIKTDHDGYADSMKEILSRDSRWSINLATDHLYKDFPNHFLSSYQTHFEKKFISQGMTIKAFILEKL